MFVEINYEWNIFIMKVECAGFVDVSKDFRIWRCVVVEDLEDYVVDVNLDVVVEVEN